MKKFIRIFSVYALVPLLMAGFCVGYVWRGNRQHQKDKALIAAIKADDAPAVIAALKQGANPNVRDMSPDVRSIQERFLDLIHHNERPLEEYDPALYVAVCNSCRSIESSSSSGKRKPVNVMIVRALLNAGANPDAIRTDSDVHNPNYTNPLIGAEEQHNCSIAHLLIEYHANIHARDARGDTPLLIATNYPDFSEIEYLLQHGADIEEQDEHQERPLLRAAINDNIFAVKCLIKHGADVNHSNIEGCTALYYAREGQNPAIEKLLLKAGAVQ